MESVNLVAPQVDADCWASRAGRIHIDDRPASGKFAAVFDDFFATVPETHEGSQRGGQGLRCRRGAATTGSMSRAPGPSFCRQAAYARNDHFRHPGGIPEAPQHVEALPHRLYVGADAFKGERFPPGEKCEFFFVEELAEIAVELPRHCAGWAGDEQRSAIRERGRVRRSRSVVQPRRRLGGRRVHRMLGSVRVRCEEEVQANAGVRRSGCPGPHRQRQGGPPSCVADRSCSWRRSVTPPLNRRWLQSDTRARRCSRCVRPSPRYRIVFRDVGPQRTSELARHPRGVQRSTLGVVALHTRH